VLPLRRLEALASGEPEQDAICSAYLNVIAERGLESAVARVLVRQLASGEVGPWDEFLLPMMAGDNPMTAALAEAFRQEDLSAELEPAGGAPYIPLPADWEEYRRSLSKKHRRLLSQALRDFADWAGTEQEVRRAGCVEELEEFKQTLIALHQQRWQQEGGVFHSAAFLSFHDEIMTWLLSRQALELAVLRVRGEPVAAAYNIIWNGKVHYYQAGRRPDLPSSVRPGLALLAQLLQGHIAAGRREFDLLPDIAQYKMLFAQAVRPIVQLRVARPGLRASLRRLVEKGAAVARSFKSPRSR
jgi:CelD/BcsL family acetyltransferase involved in cellulose biosynthesis